jgi:hypothetical protein
MRCLTFWAGKLISLSTSHPDEQKREDADDLISLITPVIKSFLTERGFLNISEAMQICGGAGYTTEWNIEQYMRDERISMIYEGTNHIQALDLVGRKIPMHDGRLLKKYQKVITDFLEENKSDEKMSEFLKPIEESFAKLQDLTQWLMGAASKDPEIMGAAASKYLNVFALSLLSFMWGIQVKQALKTDSDLAKTKLKTAHFYNQNILPEIDSLIKVVKSGKTNIMDFDTEEF